MQFHSTLTSPEDTAGDFAFGIIGDTQYCDDSDGHQWGDATRVRRYRASLPKLASVAQYFRTWSHKGGVIPLTTAVLLGDVLDGKCKRNGESEVAFNLVVDAIEKSHLTQSDAEIEKCVHTPSWHFVVGNHDFYNFSREFLYASKFFVPVDVRTECSPSKLYYSTSPHEGFRFLFLDPFEISTCGALSSSAQCEAEAVIAQKNPNVAAGGNWLENLSDADQRYVPYNGAVSQLQLEWLIEELRNSREVEEKVIVFSHCPIYSKCCRASAMTWNSDTILTLLQQSTNVIAVFGGHDHDGGYAVDSCGIHHVVAPALLEAQEGGSAHGVIIAHDKAKFLEMQWDGAPPPSEYAWPTKMPYRPDLGFEA